MRNTIKAAAFAGLALAALPSAALATSELARGITTGLTIGAPLPEGVYDISIGSYGSSSSNALGGTNSAYGIPVWLVWWTPWQIAGGRIVLDTTAPIEDLWNSGHNGTDSFGNTLLDGGIGWNFGNGWNASLHAGVWLPSQQAVPALAGRDYAAFQGTAAISYVTREWNLSATAIYGAGGGKETVAGYPAGAAQQADWFNLDLTAVRHFGKFETGVIAYGSWDLSDSGVITCALSTGVFASCKQHQFAVGGLAGYDFGAFLAQVKIAADVEEANYRGKETRGWLTIVKPLWIAAAQAPLK